MTFLQIEYFIEIVNCGSFTMAAEKLFITHQSLSVQIKALEKELGFSLFNRHNRRSLALTESGEVLYEAWTDMLKINKEALGKARDSHVKKNQLLRVGVQNVPHIRDLTLLWIEDYVEKNDLHVEFEVSDPEILIEKLNLGQLDFCSIISYTIMKETGYSTKEIGKKKSFPVIAVSKNNPLSTKDNLNLEDIKNETILVLDENYSRDVVTRVKTDFSEAGITDINLKKMKSVNEIKLDLLMNRGVTIMLNLALTDILDKVRTYEFKTVCEEDKAKIILVWKDKKWDSLFNLKKKR